MIANIRDERGELLILDGRGENRLPSLPRVSETGRKARVQPEEGDGRLYLALTAQSLRNNTDNFCQTGQCKVVHVSVNFCHLHANRGCLGSENIVGCCFRFRLAGLDWRARRTLHHLTSLHIKWHKNPDFDRSQGGDRPTQAVSAKKIGGPKGAADGNRQNKKPCGPEALSWLTTRVGAWKAAELTRPVTAWCGCDSMPAARLSGRGCVCSVVSRAGLGNEGASRFPVSCARCPANDRNGVSSGARESGAVTGGAVSALAVALPNRRCA